MLVAGVDEAGRGPLAGPVVVAAVILPEGFFDEELTDSKKLGLAVRERLEARIRTESIAWTIESAEPDEIDRLNILGATLAAARRAVLRLQPSPDRVLMDGNQLPELPCPAEAIVKGDLVVPAISAASILAKNERDRIMIRWAERYPEYGFDQHFGYPTPTHREALQRFGPCPIHRRHFAGVAPEAQGCLEL